MIAIINTDEQDDDGAYLYRLQVNDDLIAEFKHFRMDGLAVCLQRASEAAHEAHRKQIDNILRAAMEFEKAVDHE